MTSAVVGDFGFDDPEFLRRGSGDPADLNALFTAYAEDLKKFCRARGLGPEDAEDACQETFLRATRAMPRFRAGAPYWPWLATIAANVCKDMTRHNGRVVGLDPDAEDPDGAPEDELDRKERVEILRSALSAIPPHYRKALYLRIFEDWSWDDIARIDDKSVASVRSTLLRARHLLRRSIREEAKRRHQWPLPIFIPRIWRNLRARIARVGASSPDVTTQLARLQTDGVLATFAATTSALIARTSMAVFISLGAAPAPASAAVAFAGVGNAPTPKITQHAPTPLPPADHHGEASRGSSVPPPVTSASYDESLDSVDVTIGESGKSPRGDGVQYSTPGVTVGSDTDSEPGMEEEYVVIGRTNVICVPPSERTLAMTVVCAGMEATQG